MDKYLTKRKRPCEKTSQRKHAKAPSSKSQYIACPICSGHFAASRIEAHAAQCQPQEGVKTSPAPPPPKEPRSGKENDKSALEHLMQVAKTKPKPITFAARIVDGSFAVTWSHSDAVFPSAWEAKHLVKPVEKSAFDKGFSIKLCSQECGGTSSDYANGFPFNGSGLSIPVLKSCLQKAVRRQEGRVALRAAAELMKASFREFIRRITIIVLEDVMLRGTYPGLVWLLMADHKGFIPRNEHIRFCLNAVQDLCRCNKKDNVSFEMGMKPIGLNRLEGLVASESKALVGSMIVRSRYGGMGCDVRLLQASAFTWFDRLNQNPSQWTLKIQSTPHQNIQPRGFSCAPPQQPLLAGIDFHVCGWMPAKIYHTLRSNPTIQPRLERLGLASEEQASSRIQSCIWHFRSSVNHREALTARPPEPEPDPSLKELWLLIRKLVDHISQSVLQKQRRAKLDLQ